MEKKILYAIAVERCKYDKNGATWVADIEYLHATSASEAKVLYTSANPDRKKLRIVGIAPVIGYIAEDDNADVVRV